MIVKASLCLVKNTHLIRPKMTSQRVTVYVLIFMYYIYLTVKICGGYS